MKNAGSRIVRSSYSPYYKGEKIEGIITLSVDITDLKFTERKLIESEYFFKESQKIGFLGSYKADFVKDTW